MDANANYKQMWEDIGEDSGQSYLEIKFRPTYRIGLTHYLRENKIYDFLDPQPSDVVLDIACASGRQLFQIYHKVKKGYGVDISQKFLDKAEDYRIKKQITNLEFKPGVIESIPFPDNYFDKIICAEVLEHVFDKDAAIREVIRVLQPGGTLVVSVPNLNADATIWGRLLRLVGVRRFVPLEQFSQKDLFSHGDSHVREFSRQSMTKWLSENNLRVIDAKTVSFIDGPKFDFLLKLPLYFSPLRSIVVGFERLLTGLNLPFGRHMVVKVVKN